MKQWQCMACRFVCGEAAGLPGEGIAPGTRWEHIPADWEYPDCGVSKSDSEMLEA